MNFQLCVFNVKVSLIGLLGFLSVLLSPFRKLKIPGCCGRPSNTVEPPEKPLKANFADWGVTGVDAYIAKPEVAWATADGTDMVKIARQYWIAMYNRGFEGWYVYRKFDAPQMNLAATSLLKVPKRYTYPASEQTLNGSNWTAAASAIGGDEQQTKIFWDINNPPKQIGEN